MSIEIEKKYRLTDTTRGAVVEKLSALGIKSAGTVFEINSIYTNALLLEQDAIVRIRRIDERTILTFKKRFPSPAGIKHQLEEETDVEDAEALEAIFSYLGLHTSLVYEKRRQTWDYHDCEIALDELPFGWFMEIEGAEDQIKRIESELEITNLETEEATYPALTRQLGVLNGDVVEARFSH
ncbi:MAG TPA: class IV adenylate cyclase [Pyrinomonadaceae bacterium]